MRISRLNYVVLVVAAGAACKDAKRDEGEAFWAKHIGADLATVKTTLAAGEDASAGCGGVGGYLHVTPAKLGAAKVQLDELVKLCGYDVPMVRAELAVKAAEAAHAANPAASYQPACGKGLWELALQQLEANAKSDARVTALVARWTKVCPPK